MNGMINVYKEKVIRHMMLLQNYAASAGRKKSDIREHSIRMRKACCRYVWERQQRSVNC
ncbi:hypothetical protein C823_001488 [Eubacterium plexicaudatum ASF492]|nr:hypothetical protein C823_001488 [Eubacterium plexicaudatum ASF492]